MGNDKHVDSPRIRYGNECSTFIRVCERCGRFVKPDDFIEYTGSERLRNQPNATCRKCGRTKMIFEGFIKE